MGHKFIMVLTEKNKSEVTEAILGDPVHIIRNFVRARCEGFIVKKCKSGIELVDKMMKFTEIVSLTNTLEAYVKEKQAQIV